MPASTQVATVPETAKSASSGCATTTRTRSTSESGRATMQNCIGHIGVVAGPPASLSDPARTRTYDRLLMSITTASATGAAGSAGPGGAGGSGDDARLQRLLGDLNPQQRL